MLSPRTAVGPLRVGRQIGRCSVGSADVTDGESELCAIARETSGLQPSAAWVADFGRRREF